MTGRMAGTTGQQERCWQGQIVIMTHEKRNLVPPGADAHTVVIPAKEVVAKGPEKKGTTKGTNIHDDDWSPSVMKALATEARRKSFFLFSVSLCLRGNFLSRQRRAFLFLCGLCASVVQSFYAFCDTLLRGNDGVGMGFNASVHQW